MFFHETYATAAELGSHDKLCSPHRLTGDSLALHRNFADPFLANPGRRRSGLTWERTIKLCRPLEIRDPTAPFRECVCFALEGH